MPRTIQGSQNDFSSGEVDVSLKRRDDHPARKTGLRQMANMRILNSGGIQNRPGRTALFPAAGLTRIEEITMSAGNAFKIAFGAGVLKIFNAAGAVVATATLQGNGAALPWTAGNVGQVVYAQMGLSIYLTFGYAMRPQVISWDGVLVWSIADYTELVFGSGQKRTLFYRISPQGIAIIPGAQTGVGVSLVASAPLFKAGHVGTRMRFCGRQFLITAVTDPLNAVITIEESLPGSQTISFGVDPTSTFSLGDVVRGSVSTSVGQVVAISSAAKNMQVQLLNTSQAAVQVYPGTFQTFAFLGTDIIAGPGGSIAVSGASPITNPFAVTVWDEEVMNSLQGYPASCFVDNFRLGFTNFPTVPGAIAWSAINSATDLYVVGATLPNGAMFELAPDKVQVLYVVAGPESSEFVFTDKKLYYIKIDANNPLKPGSVGFAKLSDDGCAQVQPRTAQELILYVNAGRNSVMAIIAPGAYYRPFNTVNLCDFHSHLFNNIQCIAVPTADGTFNERYAYVLNGDGSMAVGKYNPKDGQVAGTVGWGPWNGAGVVSWIAAFAADVLFTTVYFGNSTMCEILDDSRYLDGSVLVNNLPAAMAAAAGLGPLWWASNQSVFLMDQTTRPMGIYHIDGTGHIIPQNRGGENLAAATLIAGLSWSAAVEPFAPDAQSGADMHQRMELRQFSKFAVYVIHSTGIAFAALFSGKLTHSSPALGAITNTRRVPAYNMHDNATLPPPSRETVESYQPTGSTFDPRVAVIKDTPGPLQILEFAMEVSS
jgi:hypothetical protein